MIFSELYGTNLDTELSTSDRTQLFTTARRKAAVNAAQVQFNRVTACCQKYGTLSITDSEPEYNLFAFLTDFIRLAGAPSIRITSGDDVRYLQGIDTFPRHDPEELDRLEPGWRAAPDGTPTSWGLKDSTGQRLLFMHPGPDITVGDVWDWIVPYIAKPTVLSADASEPFTVGGAVLLHLEPYHQGLVHFAAAQLETLRKNTDGFERQMRLYNGYVAVYLQDLRQSGPDQITLVRNYFSEGRERPQDPRRWP